MERCNAICGSRRKRPLTLTLSRRERGKRRRGLAFLSISID
jgi:hypothetical protein